jgi:hypothetical protein
MAGTHLSSPPVGAHKKSRSRGPGFFMSEKTAFLSPPPNSPGGQGIMLYIRTPLIAELPALPVRLNVTLLYQK